MSKRSFVVSALLVVLTGAQLVVAADGKARLETFAKPNGGTSFALSIQPNGELPAPAGHDVAILFDTSASQNGIFRAKALAVLDKLLGQLHEGTQVQLYAVDLAPHALTKQAVPPTGEEMTAALDKLARRTPLGATDLVEALNVAANSFSADSSHARSIVYVGDGQSGAQFVDSAALQACVDALAAKRVSVTTYSIGPRCDNALLAALANQTGGMVAIDGDGITAKQIAVYLADAAQGTVFWPAKASLPSQFAEVYPAQVPPLRADRDTILIGRLAKDAQTKAVDLSLTGEVAGQKVTQNWTATVGDTNPDYAFLPQLIDSAKANGGVALTTIGTAGLLESRRLINQGVAELARLGSQAASTGNIDGARRLAGEALRRDPTDPTAKAVISALDKQVSETVAAPTDEAAPQSVTKPKGVLKLERIRNDQAPPPVQTEFPQDDLGPAVPGDFLESQESRNRVIAEMIQREVENAVTRGRDQMAVSPEAVEQDLKLELDKVMAAPELPAELRAQLRDQLETTIKEARRRAVEHIQTEAEAQAAISARKERERLVRSLDRQDEKIKQLMDRFDALMDERRYELAEETGHEVAAIRPDLPVAVSAVMNARFRGVYEQAMQTRALRHRAFTDALYQCELAHIPFPDDEPIIYPDAAVWEELTQRRKKFASVDLKKTGPAEERIMKALDEPTSIEFVETTLADAVSYLKDRHDIEIQLDTKALDDAGVGSDTPITRELKGISLRSALRLMLGGMDLTYVVKDEVLLITTPEKASSELVTKVYPVADLVLPIQQTGFTGGFGGLGGGMGGGMMGGGMGGGMGGMGMGGGMGGMGMGGMGGMGGGGGFFNVPDDAPVSKPKALPTKQPVQQAKAAPSRKPVVLKVDVPAGEDTQAAWYDYFAAEKEISDADVRETVRQLMKARKLAETSALIEGALAAGYARPWMYEALGLSLLASGADKPRIERALMSAVDFAESPEEVMYAAQYMARSGLEKRALSIFRQVSAADPSRPEPLQYGLELATRVNDLDGLRWASLGILKQAWPADKKELSDRAFRVAHGVLEQLKADNRVKEAKAFETELATALVRDVIVKVTWTGDADVDVMMEEPSGTVCSFRNPRTTAGGVMLGDTASRSIASKDGYSEFYVCPEAFKGTYKMKLRRVWGKITAGKVTVDLYTNYGTRQQQHERQQIPLGEQDALVLFDVMHGRRAEPVAGHLVANAAANQIAVNRALLAQQLSNVAAANPNANFALSRAALEGQFPFVRNAVGYQPVIISLPSGTNFTCTGVISADRRYVRITALPMFSAIGQVTTFNIASGNTTVSPPPPQGGGGVNNGIGNPFGNGGAGGGAGGGGGNNGGNQNPGGNPPAGNP